MEEWLVEREVVAIMLKHFFKKRGWTIVTVNRWILLDSPLPLSFQKNDCKRRIKFIPCNFGELELDQGLKSQSILGRAQQQRNS